MKNESLKYLLQQYKKNELNEQEKEWLDEWYIQEAAKRGDHEHYDTLTNDLAEVWQNIENQINFPLQRKMNYTTWYFAAAAIFLVMAGTLLFQNHSSKTNAVKTVVQNTIKPGSNRAELVLANGKVIDLNEVATGKIEGFGDISITKATDGHLIYQAHNNHLANANDINIIRTPKGGQFEVTLPDGTNVFLNAVSQLSYPIQFSANERRVKLTGEAYFEVAHDQHKPFKVETDGQTIEVLGTHFNVCAYPDEQQTKTTLLEGSVKITLPQFTHIYSLLKPNEQSILKNHTAQLTTVKNIDAADEIAWKNNLFIFDNENIESIMNKLSRWYDFEVVYLAKPKVSFFGSISKYDDIKRVLRKLALTNNVKFKIEERRITIMP